MPDTVNSLKQLINALFGMNTEFEESNGVVTLANTSYTAAKNRPARVGLFIVNNHATATLIIRKGGGPAGLSGIPIGPGATYVTDPRVDFDTIAYEHQVTSTTAGATWYQGEIIIRRGAAPAPAVTP